MNSHGFDFPTALKEAQDTLDSLELDYSKALLAAAPNYALDNLEIKSAREELSDAVANQTKAAARASLVEQQAAAQKKVNDLQADVDYIQAQIDSSVSGNSVSKRKRKHWQRQMPRWHRSLPIWKVHQPWMMPMQQSAKNRRHWIL